MAARTLEEMVEKGTRKLRAKADGMKEKYNAAKPRMKEEYGNLPFGPLTKRAYNAGVDAGEYRAPDPEKWGRGFRSGAGA
jgi:hypothetical protein